MRLGRAKAARKTLKFYSINSNINPPYKVILDGNFLAALAKQKMEAVFFERLERLLHTHKFTVYTLRSALDELNLLPGEVFLEARRFGLDELEILERRDIPGAKEDSNPKQDILSLVKNGNPDGWFIATQDESLSDKIRDLPNVPQMRLARAALILESPSSSSRRSAMREERGKQSTGGGMMTNDERELVQRLRDERTKKRQRPSDDVDDAPRRKHKAKGPNPLSCKKKEI